MKKCNRSVAVESTTHFNKEELCARINTQLKFSKLREKIAEKQKILWKFSVRTENVWAALLLFNKISEILETTSLLPPACNSLTLTPSSLELSLVTAFMQYAG